jgi:thioredoxin-dependent peroxiredoxin
MQPIYGLKANAVKHFWQANVAGFVRKRRSSTTLVHPVSQATSYLFRENTSQRWLTAALLLLLGCAASFSLAEDRNLESGDQAPPFKAKDLEGKPLEFQPDKSGRWTVLVFLRGYPGYQCPLCSKQVSELLAKSDALADARADVLFVYPGVAKDLLEKSKEFLAEKQLPTGFNLAIDQDYAVVDAYRVRWRAPRETAYPSTFVIDPTGVIRYAKISQTHGDRAPMSDILAALGKP